MSALTPARLAELTRPDEDRALDALREGDLDAVRALLPVLAAGKAGLDALTLHALARKIGKLRQDLGEAKAREVLAAVGLSEKFDAYPDQLSGGQQQRVAIARSLAMTPKVMLFDEVTSALDPEMTAEVLAILAKLATDGTTMLFVTHEIEFARQISHRIVFLEKGKLLVDLPAEQFFAPDGGLAQPRVAQFLCKMRKD